MTRDSLKMTLQRDATIVGNAILALVVASFASLAIASAVMDLAAVAQ